MHCLVGFCVGEGFGPNFFGEVEGLEAGEVTGVADVHGVGDCLDRRFWFVVARFLEAREGVVGVDGGDELGSRKAHFGCEKAGGDVAEVSGWYGVDRGFL